MCELANIKDTSLSLPKDETPRAVNYAGGFGAGLAQSCFLLTQNAPHHQPNFPYVFIKLKIQLAEPLQETVQAQLIQTYPPVTCAFGVKYFIGNSSCRLFWSRSNHRWMSSQKRVLHILGNTELTKEKRFPSPGTESQLKLSIRNKAQVQHGSQNQKQHYNVKGKVKSRNLCWISTFQHSDYMPLWGTF